MSSAKDTKPIDETHDTTVESTADSTSATEAKKGTPQASPFDDEDDDDLEVHPAVSAVPPTTETPAVAATGNTAPPTTTNTAVPTEREAKLAILTEAFPTVEKEVCEFVLESHRGNVEASINALLEISDPEFQPEPAPPAPAPAPVPIASHVPTHLAPPLPQRQPDALSEGVANLNLNQGQPREIDPILLASTSTSEQQLRSDEDYARTLAAMDEYRARNNRQNAPGQQQHQNEGPSFATEMKELMDEELPKIKERFNVAADTTKKKVSEWYNQFKANRAEAAQRQAQAQAQAQGQGSSGGYSDNYRNHPNGDHWSGESDDREPIRFGANTDRDGEEVLARHRATPPLDGSSPPLPARPYDVAATTAVGSTAAGGGRRTTVEDDADWSFNPSHSVR
ncbi:ubiquitin-binding protein cue5 [Podila minutissima]|nr:ubiquitin-binding protein cue5 [Podila minutissima]